MGVAQTYEVLKSTKDLMDFTFEHKIGPIGKLLLWCTLSLEPKLSTVEMFCFDPVIEFLIECINVLMPFRRGVETAFGTESKNARDGAVRE